MRHSTTSHNTEMNMRKLGWTALRIVLVAAMYLLIWQGIAAYVHAELLIPTPLAVFKRLIALLGTADFYLTLLGSLARMLAGYAFGILLGIACAIACAASKAANALLSPLLGAIRATPVASFIILALVWMSKEIVPAFMSFLMVLPLVYGNVYQGIRSTDPQLLEMARVYGLGRLRTARQIYLPCTAPYALAALTTALGLAWKSGIAAEVLSRTKLSIGGALYDAKIYLETADLFAWTLMVILLSLLLERLLKSALRRLSRRFALVEGAGDMQGEL